MFHGIHESHCTLAGDLGGGGAFLLRGVVPLDGGLGGGACWCGRSFRMDRLESKAKQSSSVSSICNIHLCPRTTNMTS